MEELDTEAILLDLSEAEVVDATEYTQGRQGGSILEIPSWVWRQ